MMAPERTRHEWTAVFSGGGTGGHLYPALALAQALTERRPDVGAYFVGALRGVEARILPRRGVEHLLLPVEGFRRDAPARNLGVVGNLVRSLGQVAHLFQQRRPRLVVVTGGYAGGPAGIMAALMGVHLVLQEQNAVPGVTTRFLARFARQIHLAFPEAVEYLPRGARSRARISGNPVRPPRAVDRRESARRFQLDPDIPVVLVVGGSQGSRAINRAILDAVATEVQASTPEEVSAAMVDTGPGLQLLWSTGPDHLEAIQEGLNRLGSPSWVRPMGYIEAMEEALGLAQVTVSRAGAMATSEFLAWGLPAILVPLPSAAADHQRRNARALAQAGAALILEEETLEGEALWRGVQDLVRDRSARKRMAAAARQRGRPHAATEIARELDTLLPQPAPRGQVPSRRTERREEP